MKKLLVVLLALTVIGFAFAQDEAAPAPALVFGGSVQTGFQIDGPSSGDATGKLWESNNGVPGSIWLAGTFAGTNAGGKFEIMTKAYDSISADALFGWWKPIEMLTLSAGEGYGAAYTTPIEGWGAGGTGFAVKLAPVAGLTLQVEYPFSKTAATKLDFATIQAQASYAITDIATFGANLDLGAKVYIFGLNVAAVPNLTAQVDVKYENTGSVVTAEQNFAYAMGALKPSLWVQEKNATSLTWSVKPGVSYAMASVTPAAYFKYSSDASYSLGVNAAMTVEKNAIYMYADYMSAKTWDVGLRYIVSF